MQYKEIKKKLEDICNQFDTSRTSDQGLQDIEVKCKNVLNELICKIEIAREIKLLRLRMGFTNFFFHLVRNNPRHREQYYFALIAIVKYEKWTNIKENIRMNWESARLSFDRMYGMVKDFSAHLNYYVQVFDTQEVTEHKKIIEITELYSTVKAIEEKDKEIFQKVGDIIKKMDAILPPWSHI